MSIFVGLISVPIGLHYFGLVRYGIWAVISSVIAYLNISKLGINSAIPLLIAQNSKLLEQQADLLRSLFLLFISCEFELFIQKGLYNDE